jgi:hypothetical protein
MSSDFDINLLAISSPSFRITARPRYPEIAVERTRTLFRSFFDPHASELEMSGSPRQLPSNQRMSRRPVDLTVLESVLHQYERISSHIGVKQCAVPVISFAAVERSKSRATEPMLSRHSNWVLQLKISRTRRPRAVWSMGFCGVRFAIYGPRQARGTAKPECFAMFRVADRPATYAGSKLHKFNLN